MMASETWWESLRPRSFIQAIGPAIVAGFGFYLATNWAHSSNEDFTKIEPRHWMGFALAMVGTTVFLSWNRLFAPLIVSASGFFFLPEIDWFEPATSEFVLTAWMGSGLFVLLILGVQYAPKSETRPGHRLLSRSNDDLVVFVHGLGSTIDQTWGTTIDSLQQSRLGERSALMLWSYRSHKGPPSPLGRFLAWFGVGSRVQTIDQLGEHLWSDLRSWHADYRQVVLVSHSMGGLVVAAALVRGLDSAAGEDRDVAEKIAGQLLIGSPLGGAGLAGRAFHFFRVVGVGSNVHLQDLRKNSPSRKRLIDAYDHQVLLKGPFPVVVFRAGEDVAVKPDELLEGLAGRPTRVEVLEGAHSTCLRDLTESDLNLEKLVREIDRVLDDRS